MPTDARTPLTRPRRVAVGDPQAPFSVFLAILRRHRLLDGGDRLRDEVALVSIGDHFDWGGKDEREEAARSGFLLLAWLASHPADQVALVLGNHDLARVCELLRFDDASFAEAQREADAIYLDASCDRAREQRFLESYPELPSAESIARDLATFRSEQRGLVAELLRAGRFCLGLAAADDLLLCHAGVTRDDLRLAGLGGERHADARAVAGALNAALDAAVAGWDGRVPLRIPGLHEPGNAAAGEARGILLQRPAHPASDPQGALFAGPPRRRFDPRWLPAGLTQAVGHIRDAKCRTLLEPWSDAAPPRDGPLRHLRVRGDDVRYGGGLPVAAAADAATLLFLDGGMNFVTHPDDYELLDLDTRRPARAL
jgi:hypothetical protein